MKKRTIVVEDFSTSRQTNRRTSENIGYLPDEAVDGREALLYVEGSKVEAVISDFMVSDRDMATLRKPFIIGEFRKSVQKSRYER
jgi:CheY-like chemotaxis protein